MKNTRKRSRFIYLILFGSLAGLGYFTYEFFKNAGYWALQPFNKHLSERSSDGGKIIDKNGYILAQTKNGKRIYADNPDIRKAMLHIVGDGSVLISTSIQSRYVQELFGYSLITGLGAPELLSKNKDIKLTLDSEICSTVSKAFNGRKGAAIAYNYLTGEVICSVSLPTYDVYNKPDLTKDKNGTYEGVYINRVLSSSFVPGSIFKLFTTAAMLNNIKNPEIKLFECKKVKLYDGEKVTCMASHGKINLQTGLSKSCDIVFGDIAVELGQDLMKTEIEKFGFNREIKIDGMSLSKSKYNLDGASKADLAWSGIGQYKDLVNPTHMLMVMGAFANGGKPVKPFFIKEILLRQGIPIFLNSPTTYEEMVGIAVSEKIRVMMRNTMKNQYGDSMFPGMKICAKTGTGEVGEGEAPHGWMVGFSEDKKFPFAFVVVVENSGFGIKTAGPIASVMMKAIKLKFSSI